MPSTIVPPIPFFTDLNGEALEDGYIYIGTENLNPKLVANQIAVYWDSALTIPAAQPIRTNAGYPSRNGAAAQIFIAPSLFSISIYNKFNRLITYQQSFSTFDIGLRADLANTSNPALGAALIGWLRAATSAVATTLKSWISWQEINAWEFFTVAQIADVQAGTALLDVTAALNAADVAATAAKRRLKIPGGTYSVTAVTFNAPHVVGDGWNATILKGSTAADNIVTLASASTVFEHVQIISSIASASRTGVGVKITGGVRVLCKNIISNGHKYGFWNQGQGNEFEHCFGGLNNSHGFFIDGSVSAQNEIGLYYCQSNGNGGDGYRILGPSTGVFFVRPTAASNTGSGITAVSAVPAVSGPVSDVFITQPELSTNGGRGIDFLNDTAPGASGLTVSSGIVEIHTLQGIYIPAGFDAVSIGGGLLVTGSVQGGIVLGGSNASIGNVTLAGNAVAAIRLGATSTGVSISGVQGDITGGQPVGLLVDVGAAAFTASAMDFSASASPLSGVIPSGSKLRGCPGFNDYNLKIDNLFAIGRGTQTLVNGLNSNIVTGNASYLKLTGPTGVFSVGGFDVPSDGRILKIYNNVAFQMTIVNEDASSTAVNRISTLTGANVVLRAGTSFAEFIYDSVVGRWILTSSN